MKLQEALGQESIDWQTDLRFPEIYITGQLNFQF